LNTGAEMHENDEGMEDAIAGDGEAPFAEIRDALRLSLLQASEVAGPAEYGGYPTALVPIKLAAQADLNRKTVANYLGTGQGSGDTLKMDVRTICRMSKVLNVSPGFLLMTKRDWCRLADGLKGAMSEADRIHVAKIRRAREPQARGQACLDLARHVGALARDEVTSSNASDQESGPWRGLLKRAQERSRLGVLSACSLLPFDELDDDGLFGLVNLCSLVGAVTDIH
jgi:hypothetical protein